MTTFTSFLLFVLYLSQSHCTLWCLKTQSDSWCWQNVHTNPFQPLPFTLFFLTIYLFLICSPSTLCSNFLCWFSCEQELSQMRFFFCPLASPCSFSFLSTSFHLIGHTRNGSDSFLRKLHPLPVCVPFHLPPSTPPVFSSSLVRRLREQPLDEQWCW